ncbi:hypothetical protein MUN81_00255 [Hymenobacter sp. 5317J-9]|uniref:hypothetical protein n=1 Tax=Hymenobacter sp. 5317J-9 TaxID=2932250 RepID=UPI001FD6842A|nr:hypothetical protein [Hymenobacter sp. 5317J-9]UOQ97947.1 hypothetical protein MUN81_00255 [Hymenobacter sp. 5317J-9]
MLYADKYENHFLNIETSRGRLAEFARYTATALDAPGTPAALAALAPALGAALTAFDGGLSNRTAGSGSTQSGTRTEDAVWRQVQALVQELDVTKVKPAYFGQPAELLAVYPDKLSGLTQAPKTKRLARFRAYVEALEARAKKLGADGGARARALLTQYGAATAGKQTAQKAVRDSIATLGPDAEALCAALWEVHTGALWAHRAAPAQAAAYFDYALLATPARKAKAAQAAKAAPAA